MTLDQAKAMFEAHPSPDNAVGYLKEVIQYHEDGMVGIETVIAACVAVANKTEELA